MSAADLIAMLRKRYVPPEWALLDELHDGTGAASRRRFDAVAFNCWPSGGYARLGFEVKITRSDFSRELEDHEKRRALEDRCHQVWFVVGPNVCQPREIPEPWGCMVVAGDGLRAVVKAKHRDVGPVSEPLAICAIRRLVSANAAAEARRYVFEGTELAQLDLDTRIAALLASEEKAYAARAAKLFQRQAEVEELRRAAEADAGRWWEVWKQVQNAAYGHRFTPASQTPPTQAEIVEAVHRIRALVRGELAGALRNARDKLDFAIAAIEAAPVEPS